MIAGSRIVAENAMNRNNNGSNSVCRRHALPGEDNDSGERSHQWEILKDPFCCTPSPSSTGKELNEKDEDAELSRKLSFLDIEISENLDDLSIDASDEDALSPFCSELNGGDSSGFQCCSGKGDSPNLLPYCSDLNGGDSISISARTPRVRFYCGKGDSPISQTWEVAPKGDVSRVPIAGIDDWYMLAKKRKEKAKRANLSLWRYSAIESCVESKIQFFNVIMRGIGAVE